MASEAAAELRHAEPGGPHHPDRLRRCGAHVVGLYQPRGGQHVGAQGLRGMRNSADSVSRSSKTPI